MSRFSVYPNPSGKGYLIDLQSDLMSQLNTRVVAPLMHASDAPKPASTLNPLFNIDGEPYVMVTQFMAAIRASELKQPVLDASARHAELVAAVDLVFHGF